jgi:hypothetical protein
MRSGSESEIIGHGTKLIAILPTFPHEPHLMQYIIPILALFQGRVIDMPEQEMPDTVYSTGGEVEHEVSLCLNLRWPYH